MKSLLPVVAILSTCCAQNLVKIFSEPFGKGESYSFYMSGCFHLSSWRKSVASIDPGSSCVKLYEREGCQGKSSGDVERNVNLVSLRSNSDIENFKSIGGCDPWVTLYDKTYHLGSSFVISLDKKDCIDVNFNNWNRRAKSVHTHDTCVVLYKNRGCRGESFAMAPGIPYQSHLDLSEHDFSGQIASVGRYQTKALPPTNWFQNQRWRPVI